MSSRQATRGGASSALLWLVVISLASWFAIALVVELVIRLGS
jgi:hypothetical protein